MNSPKSRTSTLFLAILLISATSADFYHRFVHKGKICELKGKMLNLVVCVDIDRNPSSRFEMPRVDFTAQYGTPDQLQDPQKWKTMKIGNWAWKQKDFGWQLEQSRATFGVNLNLMDVGFWRLYDFFGESKNLRIFQKGLVFKENARCWINPLVDPDVFNCLFPWDEGNLKKISKRTFAAYFFGKKKSLGSGCDGSVISSFWDQDGKLVKCWKGDFWKGDKIIRRPKNYKGILKNQPSFLTKGCEYDQKRSTEAKYRVWKCDADHLRSLELPPDRFTPSYIKLSKFLKKIYSNKWESQKIKLLGNLKNSFYAILLNNGETRYLSQNQFKHFFEAKGDAKLTRRPNALWEWSEDGVKRSQLDDPNIEYFGSSAKMLVEMPKKNTLKNLVKENSKEKQLLYRAKKQYKYPKEVPEYGYLLNIRKSLIEKIEKSKQPKSELMNKLSKEEVKIVPKLPKGLDPRLWEDAKFRQLFLKTHGMRTLRMTNSGYLKPKRSLRHSSNLSKLLSREKKLKAKFANSHRPFIDHSNLGVRYRMKMRSGKKKRKVDNGNLYFEFRGIPLLKNAAGLLYRLDGDGTKKVKERIYFGEFLRRYGAEVPKDVETRVEVGKRVVGLWK